MKMRLADLKIDPDFKNLLPELDAETYTALERDISKNGVLDPIIIWKGYIADGHNRYSICKAHRVAEVETKELHYETKSQVMKWIVDHQFGKRNLLKSERIKILAKVEEQIAKEAAMRVGGRPKKDDEKPSPNLDAVLEKQSGRTDEIMAKKLGVSKNTYRDMKTIVDKGTPEQIARMDRGGSGNGASTIAREIKAGAKDDERVCIKCGKIKKIEFFTNKKNPNCCNQCEAERQRMAYSAAPRANYYDVNATVTWTFDDVEGEIDHLIERVLDNLRTTYDVHKTDVFASEINRGKFANKLNEFAGKIKSLNKELKNEHTA